MGSENRKQSGSLRMKETAVERAARKAARRARKAKKDRREKDRKRGAEVHGQVDAVSDSPEHRYQARKRQDGPPRYFEASPEPVKPSNADSNAETDDNCDADVPQRPRADRPYIPYTFDEDDPESRLPAAAAHKSDLHDDAAFREKLFEAMRDDEGVDPYSRAALDAGINYDYRQTLPDRFGANGVYNDHYIDSETGAVINRIIFKDAMTDEEYAEHIRRGMFRRTRREEVARLEELDRLKKEKERKRAAEIARTRALEEERIRKLEERAKRKAQQGVAETREQYQAAWLRLLDPSNSDTRLRSSDFPWPIGLEAASGTTVFDKDAVFDFLVAHIPANGKDAAKKRKQAVRTAVLAYHPDRFERYLSRVNDVKEQASVREMGLRISQLLNELMQEV